MFPQRPSKQPMSGLPVKGRAAAGAMGPGGSNSTGSDRGGASGAVFRSGDFGLR